MNTSSLKLFVIGLSVLIGAFAQASSSAETLLSQDLATVMKLTPKTALVYNYSGVNYADVKSLNSPSRRASWATKHLLGYALPFWSSGSFGPSSLAAGVGLYVATDPASSKGYGNLLSELTIPAGTRVLDLSQKLRIRPATAQALVAEGYFNDQDCAYLFLSDGRCDANPVLKAYFLTKISFKENRARYSKFRKLFQRIMSNYKIQLIEYKWSSSYTQKFCGSATSALIVLSSTRSELSQFPTNIVFFNGASPIPFENLSPGELESYNRSVKFRNTMGQIRGIEDPKKRQAAVASLYSPMELATLKNLTYKCQ